MSARTSLLLFAALVVFFSLGNWALPLIDRDEPRFAEASREMLERGEFIVPTFNGAPRYDKPALIYWCQMAAYKLFGDNEFAARFPSTLFAAGAAVLIALWGARLFDPTTGFRAALIFALSLQMLTHGRAAVADMPMIFFAVLAAWAGWEIIAPHPAREWRSPWIIFWGALGLGFLAKGPIAWIPIGMVAFAAWREKPFRFCHRMKWAVGILLMLGIMTTWGIPALIVTKGEFAQIGLGKHVWARSVVALEGHGSEHIWGWLGSLPFYFVTVFASFFPWSIWLVPAVRKYWSSRDREPIERYLISGTLLVFIIFSLSRTKLPHYTLPAFPFMALLLAAWWREAKRSERLFQRTAIIMAGVAVALTLIGFPLIAPLFPSRALAEVVNPHLTPETQVALNSHEEPSNIWEFRKIITPYVEKVRDKRVAEWMAQPGPRILVMPTEKLGKVLPQPDPAWQQHRVQRVNPVNARKLDLTVVIRKD